MEALKVLVAFLGSLAEYNNLLANKVLVSHTFIIYKGMTFCIAVCDIDCDQQKHRTVYKGMTFCIAVCHIDSDQQKHRTVYKGMTFCIAVCHIESVIEQKHPTLMQSCPTLSTAKNDRERKNNAFLICIIPLAIQTSTTFLGISLRKHPFLLNVPSGEERGETDLFPAIQVCICVLCVQVAKPVIHITLFNFSMDLLTICLLSIVSRSC